MNSKYTLRKHIDTISKLLVTIKKYKIEEYNKDIIVTTLTLRRRAIKRFLDII